MAGKCKRGKVWDTKLGACRDSSLKKGVSEKRSTTKFAAGRVEHTTRSKKKKGVFVTGSTKASRASGEGNLSKVANQYRSTRKRTVSGPFKKVSTSKTVKRESAPGGRERVESQREYKLFGKTIKGKKRVKVKKRGKAKKRFHSMSKRHPDYDY